jgi:hypothetical protein
VYQRLEIKSADALGDDKSCDASDFAGAVTIAMLALLPGASVRPA